ncbi:MAG: hypothetical protein HQL90_04115 [Magnetococcales bacterium]|nr:hypothetical protein [Magnetococcales bacterium]
MADEGGDGHGKEDDQEEHDDGDQEEEEEDKDPESESESEDDEKAKLKREAEEARHAARSQAGRLSALQASINQLAEQNKLLVWPGGIPGNKWRKFLSSRTGGTPESPPRTMKGGSSRGSRTPGEIPGKIRGHQRFGRAE